MSCIILYLVISGSRDYLIVNISNSSSERSSERSSVADDRRRQRLAWWHSVEAWLASSSGLQSTTKVLQAVSSLSEKSGLKRERKCQWLSREMSKYFLLFFVGKEGHHLSQLQYSLENIIEMIGKIYPFSCIKLCKNSLVQREKFLEKSEFLQLCWNQLSANLTVNCSK